MHCRATQLLSTVHWIDFNNPNVQMSAPSTRKILRSNWDCIGISSILNDLDKKKLDRPSLQNTGTCLAHVSRVGERKIIASALL